MKSFILSLTYFFFLSGYPGVNSVAPGPLAQCNNYYSDIVFVVDSTPTYMNNEFWKKVKDFLAEVAIVLGAGLDDRIRVRKIVDLFYSAVGQIYWG